MLILDFQFKDIQNRMTDQIKWIVNKAKKCGVSTIITDDFSISIEVKQKK